MYIDYKTLEEIYNNRSYSVYEWNIANNAFLSKHFNVENYVITWIIKKEYKSKQKLT